MKKALITLALLTVCLVAFAANYDTSTLSTEAVNNFTNQALFIQTTEDTSVFTNLWNYRAHGYSNVIDFYFSGPSYVYTETKIKWTPYQGTTELTKDQFYTIIGREDEATRYQNFKKSRSVWTSVTVGSLIAGAACAVGTIYTDGPLFTSLCVASGLGLLTACVGFFVLDFVLVEEDQFSVTFAMNAAQTYNVSLLATYATN